MHSGTTTSYLQVIDTAWFWLAWAIIGNAGGNVLMKVAAKDGAGFFEVYFSPSFLTGAALFGVGLMCYMRALGNMSLAVAYLSVVGLSIVAITAMAIVLFGERLSVANLVGVLLIFAGVVLLTRSGAVV
jgi:multidrug transporter EmrE-like cation transporter